MFWTGPDHSDHWVSSPWVWWSHSTISNAFSGKVPQFWTGISFSDVSDWPCETNFNYDTLVNFIISILLTSGMKDAKHDLDLCFFSSLQSVQLLQSSKRPQGIVGFIKETFCRIWWKKIIKKKLFFDRIIFNEREVSRPRLYKCHPHNSCSVRLDKNGFVLAFS